MVQHVRSSLRLCPRRGHEALCRESPGAGIRRPRAGLHLRLPPAGSGRGLLRRCHHHYPGRHLLGHGPDRLHGGGTVLTRLCLRLRKREFFVLYCVGEYSNRRIQNSPLQLRSPHLWRMSALRPMDGLLRYPLQARSLTSHVALSIDHHGAHHARVVLNMICSGRVMIPSKKKKVHQRVHHYTLSTTRKSYPDP